MDAWETNFVEEYAMYVQNYQMFSTKPLYDFYGEYTPNQPVHIPETPFESLHHSSRHTDGNQDLIRRKMKERKNTKET